MSRLPSRPFNIPGVEYPAAPAPKRITGKRKPKPDPVYPIWTIEDLLSLVNVQDLTLAQAAKRIGITRSAVSSRIKRNGYEYDRTFRMLFRKGERPQEFPEAKKNRRAKKTRRKWEFPELLELVNSRGFNLAEAAREFGICPPAFYPVMRREGYFYSKKTKRILPVPKAS